MPNSSQWCPATGWGAVVITKTQEVPHHIGEEILYSEGIQALEQTAQGAHGVSLSEVIPKPSACVPVSPALGALALGSDWMTSRGPFQL